MPGGESIVLRKTISCNRVSEKEEADTKCGRLVLRLGCTKNTCLENESHCGEACMKLQKKISASRWQDSLFVVGMPRIRLNATAEALYSAGLLMRRETFVKDLKAEMRDDDLYLDVDSSEKLLILLAAAERAHVDAVVYDCLGDDDSSRSRAQIDAAFFLSASPKPNMNKIKKLSKHNSTRFAFVAGLEGSGHHAFTSIFDTCRKFKLCTADRDLSELLYNCHSTEKSKSLFLSSSQDNTGVILKKQEAFKQLLLYKKVSSSSLIVLNTLAPDTDRKSTSNSIVPGMVSYPNCMGPVATRAEQRPDIYQLASLAESAQADLRIIVLARSPEQILHSTAQRRRFSKNTFSQAAVLVKAADALAAQLNRLDPEFYVCFPYARLADYDFWVSRASWLHPLLRPSSHSVNKGYTSTGEILHEITRAVRPSTTINSNLGSSSIYYYRHTRDSSNNASLNTASLLFSTYPAVTHLSLALRYLHQVARCPPAQSEYYNYYY